MAKCGKKMFPSMTAAYRALINMPTDKLVTPCAAYWCKACKAAHLTSKPRYGGRKKW